VLALAKDDGSDADTPGILKRITQQGVGFNAGLAVRFKIVGLVEVEIGDFASWYERANVERLGGRHSRLLKILVRHDNVVTLFVLIALNNVLPRHFDAFL